MDCTYITLNCADCENSDCDLANKYIPDGSNEGCTRRVPEDIAALYYHYIEEVLPFMYIKTSKEYQNRMYKEIIDFFYRLYAAPIGRKLNRSGKATKLLDQ